MSITPDPFIAWMVLPAWAGHLPKDGEFPVPKWGSSTKLTALMIRRASAMGVEA